MIKRLAGWTVTLLPAGAMMEHPAGAAVARVYYRERVTPVRRIPVLAAEILRAWPAFQIETTSALERLTTDDGELAALVTVRGREHDVPVQRVLGFVVTDDFYSSVASTSSVAARFEEMARLTRELVAGDEHGLGVRRRRFEYTPPPGFQPRRRSLTTEWLAPDYPANETTLWVHPASPRGHEALDELVAKLAALSVSDPTFRVQPVSTVPMQLTPQALLGAARSVLVERGPGAPALLRFVAVLRDERYDYPLELLTVADDRRATHEAIFAQLIASVRPLPAPRGGTAPSLLDYMG